jgi:hypothetical protein
VESTVFWNVTPCSLVELYKCFRGTHYFYPQGVKHSTCCLLVCLLGILLTNDGGGSTHTFVLKVGEVLPDCMVSCHRRS